MEAIGYIVTGIFGGGLCALVATIVTGRRTAEKIRAQTQTLEARRHAEVDSVTVQGAEGAVRSLQAANEVLETEIERLCEDNRRLRKARDELEARIAEYRDMLERTEGDLVRIRRDHDALRAEIASLRGVG